MKLSYSLLFRSLILLTISTSALSGIGNPPRNRSFTVGSHPDCDFPNINTAIASEFPCTNPRGCFTGTPTLLVSQNYYKPALIFINQTINIYGGYDNFCTGAHVANSQSVLDSAGPNTSGKVMYIYPPDGETINVFLKDVVLAGANGNNNKQGGVLVMDPGFGTPGQINLSLLNSLVVGGLSERGGGIYMNGNHKLNIHQSTISGNRALAGSNHSGNGGGIYCKGGAIDFVSGNIQYNEANTTGGGIVLENCTLTGSGINTSRYIQNNKILRGISATAAGKGAGIYAGGVETIINLGGLLSRTQIKNNEVAKYNFDIIPIKIATGGGLHLQRSAQAILRNVEFIGNEAPSGGAISMESNSLLDMDRTTGPCLNGSPEGCSAFIDNKATGNIVFAGPGSAIYSSSRFINNTNIQDIIVKRTVFHGNYAYTDNGRGGLGTMIEASQTNTYLMGNLMFLNALEDNTGIIRHQYGRYISLHGSNNNNINIVLAANTIAYNENSGSVLFLSSNISYSSVIGNLIYDPDQEYGIMDNDISSNASYSACNVTSDEHIAADLYGDGDIITTNPKFLDFSVGNFRLQPDSVATNRCDESQIALAFDISGRARPNPNGLPPANGGIYDAGAFEYQFFATPNEVDLRTHVRLVEPSTPYGGKYIISARNIGLTPLRQLNYHVQFDKPAQAYHIHDASTWSCEEMTINGVDVVDCRRPTSGTLNIDVASSAPSLYVSVSPDANGQCMLKAMTYSSGSSRRQIDTDLSNNSVLALKMPCSISDDLIFADNF